MYLFAYRLEFLRPRALRYEDRNIWFLLDSPYWNRPHYAWRHAHARIVRECPKNVNSYIVREGHFDQKNMKKTTKIKPSWKNHIIFEENSSISMSSKIFVRIHVVLRKLCPMCPITHVPYCPCALLPMCPIPQGSPSVSVSINQYTIYLCDPLPKVPHWLCATLLMCQKDVKLSKRCQVVKKMSNVKKSKHIDYGGGSQKK